MASRLFRQALAAAAMAGVLIVMRGPLGGFFLGSTVERLIGVGALVSAGVVTYFALAWIIGGMNKDDLFDLIKRKKTQ